MMVERFKFWVSTRRCGTRVGCLGFSDGISFWFGMAEIDDSRWIGVFGCVEIKGGWGLGIVGIGCDGMSDGVSLWV